MGHAAARRMTQPGRAMASINDDMDGFDRSASEGCVVQAAGGSSLGGGVFRGRRTERSSRSTSRRSLDVVQALCQDSLERFPTTMQVLLHRATNRTIPSFLPNNVADTVSNSLNCNIHFDVRVQNRFLTAYAQDASGGAPLHHRLRSQEVCGSIEELKRRSVGPIVPYSPANYLLRF